MFTGVHVGSLGDAGLHHLVGDRFIRAFKLRLPAQHTHPELATVRGIRLPHPEAAGRGETGQRQTQHAHYPQHGNRSEKSQNSNKSAFRSKWGFFLFSPGTGSTGLVSLE